MSLDVTLMVDGDEVFSANVTHNLNKMAVAAGIYECVWRPDEIEITKAGQIIEPLKLALADMTTRPSHYKTFDSPNGWGLYRHFLPWLAEYLEACIAHPEAIIHISR